MLWCSGALGTVCILFSLVVEFKLHATKSRCSSAKAETMAKEMAFDDDEEQQQIKTNNQLILFWW